jgi:hypothetical protein
MDVVSHVKKKLKRITRPDNPGRIFSKYPAPPKSAKDLKQNSPGQGPDFCPDICPDLPQGRIFRAGYFQNIRPPPKIG